MILDMKLVTVSWNVESHLRKGISEMKSIFHSACKLGHHDLGFLREGKEKVTVLRCYSPNKVGEPERTAVAVGIDPYKEAKKRGIVWILLEGDGADQRAIVSVQRMDDLIKGAYKSDNGDGEFAVINWRDVLDNDWSDAPRLI